MKKIIALITTVILFSPTISGQTQTAAIDLSVPSPSFGSTKDVIAPSPSAGSLGIFGQIPVGCYTGTAEISIPLYNIQYKDLSVPISIAYHTSGNKPDIFPGPVGLCWAIQAGGNITRTIIGNPDTGGLMEGELVPILVGEANEREREKWWDVTEHYGEILQASGITFVGEVDPDEYNYNINGETGRFYLNHKDTFEVQSEQGSFFTVTMNKRTKQEYTFPELEQMNVSVDYEYNPTISIYNVINGFTMIDVNGVKYTFGNADGNYDNDNAIEFSRLGFAEYYDGDTKFDIQPMSWQLTSIESPNGYKIQFVYDRSLYITRIRFSDLALYSVSNATRQRSMSSEDEDAYRSTLINGSVLKEITTPNGKAVFSNSKATEQLDYPRINSNEVRDFNQFFYYPDIAFADTENTLFPTKIDSIRIYDSENNKVQKIGFQYTNKRNTRLKLQSIDITDNQANPQRYQFKYNSMPLPPYLSNQTDYCGFYNGKTLYAGVDTDPDHDGYITSLMLSNPNYIDQMKMPDFNYAKAEILESILYPTKGYTVFEYEPHDYQAKYDGWAYGLETLSAKNTDAGGVRIKSVKNYNNDNVLLSSKKYVYTMQRNGSTVSSGILAYKPTYVEQHNNVILAYREKTGGWQTNNTSYYTTDEQGYWGNKDNNIIDLTSFIRFSTNPIYPMSESRGNHITYSEVKIVEEGNGYQINKYKNFDNGYADRPLLGYLTNDVRDYNGQKIAYWKQEDGNSMKAERGQLLSQEFYKNDGTKIRQIDFKYNDDENRFEEGVRFIRKTKNDVALTFHRSCRITAGLIYTYFPYLKQKKTTDYLQGSSIVQTIDYTYNEQYRLQKTVTVKDSRNNNSVTETFYPFDRTDESYMQDLINAKRLNLPVEIRQTVNGSTRILKNSYSLFNGIPRIANVMSNTAAKNALESRIAYNNYDSYGNPVYIVKDATDKVVYLWSYNYQYPIAEIKGATFDQVKLALGYSDSQVDSLAAQSSPDVSLIDSKLRAYFKDMPTSATTYTFKPLVGMSSMTDPSGIVTKYDYDSFGRLIKVANEDKLVETYDYHYSDKLPPSVTVLPPPKIEILDISHLLESTTTYTTTARIHISKPCAVSFAFAHILSPNVSGSLTIGNLFNKTLSGSEIGNISSLNLPAGDIAVEIRLTGNLREATTESAALIITGTECSDMEIGNYSLDGSYTWTVTPPLLY